MLAQINLANYFIYDILGSTKMAATDDATHYHIKTALVDYSCMRVLVVLMGGVVTEGFEWSAGVSIRQPHILSTYINLINQFKEAAQLHLRAIQPICVSDEWTVPSVGKTAPSVM